ncbi:ribbon-helix-helix domain-containing protein [Litoribrevibacter euphylliae]|uniref:Ribbon-helix-helix domain-containing protein n=1 Tax=Litoribrevibacter euphylliae TaxID=1834034 RepID=A0ABV7HFR4_9GAMM
MCQLFINADESLWVSKTRSLRVDGVVTSVRLENFFWDVLEELASRDGMTVTQMISKLYLESMDAEHDISNFSSFLRVCCGRYLSMTSDGLLQRDLNEPLESVDSSRLLKEEQAHSELRQTRRQKQGQTLN